MHDQQTDRAPTPGHFHNSRPGSHARSYRVTPASFECTSNDLHLYDREKGIVILNLALQNAQGVVPIQDRPIVAIGCPGKASGVAIASLTGQFEMGIGK